ncbi:nicotinamidase-related amidase [Bradyrhizobium sp. i1.8.4]|uniref:isochorismatase family protein n=1 Tax=unclassified Bradyrhizobium TaxID=2631580 RepID=UPI003D1CE7A5
MTAAKTLMQLAGIDLTPPRLGEACLVLIDIQNEYLAGPLALPDANPAIARATALLVRARESGAAIIHIAHKGQPGSLFDRTAERGAIVAPLEPRAGEIVSSTARAALDLGFRTTVDADSCATRDLPDGVGGTIAARLIHDVALAELSDRFAIIARGDALA